MDRDKAIRAAKLTIGGMLEKNRHATAVGRTGGQVAPSKYMPNVPRAVHADGGAANAPMFQGIHPDLQDESGAPLNLYHGTPQGKEFEAFDDAKLGARDAGFHGRGHYLTPSMDMANEYTMGDGDPGEGMIVGPLHAALKNPYIWDVSDDMKSNKTLRDLQSMGIMRDKSELRSWDNLQQHHVQPFMAEMKKRGHDGVVVKTGYEHHPNGISEVVAFDPKNIKHTDAEAFDPTDPRIRREDGGAVDGITAYHASPEDIVGQFRPSARDVGIHFAANPDLAHNAAVKSLMGRPDMAGKVSPKAFKINARPEQIVDIPAASNRFDFYDILEHLHGTGRIDSDTFNSTFDGLQDIEDKISHPDETMKAQNALFSKAMSKSNIKALRYMNRFDAGPTWRDMEEGRMTSPVTPDHSYIVTDPSAIQHQNIAKSDGGEVESKRDFFNDNPGGEWLKGKQARAAQYPDDKFMVGATTGVIGSRSNMFLPTHVLKGIAGLNDEVRTAGVSKYDSLLSDAQESGFDPDQKNNKVVVAVNHYGQPYLLEGNTRVAVAHSMGIPKVKAEVRYWNGAENVDGPMHPEKVFGMASDNPEIAKAAGGQVMGYVPMATLPVSRLAVARAPVQQQQAPAGRFSDSLSSLMDTVEGFKGEPDAPVDSPSAASEGHSPIGMIAMPESGYEATGMYAPFQSAIDQMIADAPGKITVTSGYRTPERQEELWNEHAAKYPDPEVRDNYVARPGQSSHNYGLAADLSYADEEALKWAQENAAKYGLNFRMGHEDWHIEPANIWELRNAMTVPGYSNGGSAMDDNNQDTSGGNNVESLSLARSLRNIGSGGGDDRVQGLFDKIAAGQQQAQKAYEMAHSNGEFDDFKIGDTFVYKHSKYPTPMKITGFSVSRAESFPQRKRIYNNHVPVLEMEDQDAGKKVNNYPVEAFQENRHKYDFVSGKPRAVKAGGGMVSKALALTRGFTKDGKSAISALKVKGK